MSSSVTFHDTLISSAQLATLLAQVPSPDVLVLDCSFDLVQPAAGGDSYAAAHIPGAFYMHLDQDLSGPKPGSNGRHPLPDRAEFAHKLAALGASDDTQLVVYDRSEGMYAARLWWMLRWIGHAASAVLDGGFQAWTRAGLPISSAAPAQRAPGSLTLRSSLVPTLTYAELRAQHQSARVIVDARAQDRFEGRNETLDPVGGHIPGALNRPFRTNLGSDGAFKAPAELRAEFQKLFGSRAPTEVVNQCGSGVTACHNLLAMEVAGLHGAALYPGSWSEWCAQPDAPIATG